MRKILLLLALFASAYTFAQDGSLRRDYGKFSVDECSSSGGLDRWYKVSNNEYKAYFCELNKDACGELFPNITYHISKTRGKYKRFWTFGIMVHSFRNRGFVIKDKARVLIKYKDNTESPSMADVFYHREKSGFGTFVGITLILSENGINKLEEVGIKKMRIEAYPDILECEFSDADWSKFISQAKDIVDGNYINPKKDKMTDGF